MESALIVKSIRLAESTPEDSSHEGLEQHIDVSLMTITDVQEGHSGDRVCVDLLSMLEEGEGMLVGSTAKAFVLIHGETIASKYVPTRPFRVNAGSVDAAESPPMQVEFLSVHVRPRALSTHLDLDRHPESALPEQHPVR